MASELDKKKAKAEALRVQANIAEMEVRIEDHKENIARLEMSMAASESRLLELNQIVKNMEI